MPIELVCQICGGAFVVPPSRVGKAKYCSKECAYKGQPLNRECWLKGKDKSDPRVAASVEKRKQTLKEKPWINRGVNHHAYGKPMPEYTRQRLEEGRRNRVMTPEMLRGLEIGRSYFKGKTKENNASVRARAIKLSNKYTGIANPRHAEFMRNFYDENPDKHPCRLRASRGNPSSELEVAMHNALIEACISFETQYKVLRYYIDFAVVDSKVAIEADGEYWHKGERKERDIVRDEKLRAEGWIVIRFPGKRIVKDIGGCLAEIKATLERASHPQ